MKKSLALRAVLVALVLASVPALLAGCSDKGPDKPVVDKSQYQAPQSSFQKNPGAGGQAAPR